jgi:hypothetical protein
MVSFTTCERGVCRFHSQVFVHFDVHVHPVGQTGFSRENLFYRENPGNWRATSVISLWTASWACVHQFIDGRAESRMPFQAIIALAKWRHSHPLLHILFRLRGQS